MRGRRGAPGPERNGWRRTTAYVGVCLLGALAIGVVAQTAAETAGLAQSNRRLAEQVRVTAVSNCRRANVSNAWDRSDPSNRRRSRVGARVLPILYCVDTPTSRGTIRAGTPHPPRNQRAYVRAIDKGRLPIFRDGRYVRSIPFPPVSRITTGRGG